MSIRPKPDAASLSKEARDLAEMRQRRRQAMGLARSTGLKSRVPALTWRDRLPTRTTFLILGVVVAVHAALFFLLKDGVLFEAYQIFKVNFAVKEVPEKVVDGQVVAPGQRNYTVSSSVLDLPSGQSRPAPEPISP